MRKVVWVSLYLLFICTLIPEAKGAVAPGVGIVTDSLILYYDINNPGSFQNNGYLYNLADPAGNSFQATINNSPSYSRTATGSYLAFTGGAGEAYGTNTRHSITIGSMNPDYSNGFSISFYATFGTTVDSWERIFDFGNSNQDTNFLLGRYWGDSNIFYESWPSGFSGGSNAWCKGPATGTTGAIVTSNPPTYQQYTLVISKLTTTTSTCTWYLNGTSIPGSSTTTSGTNFMPVTATRSRNYIGRSNWSGDNYFEGQLMRIAFYNKALSSTEVTQNYQSMTDVTYPASITGGTASANENQTSVTTIQANETGTYYLLNNNDYSKFNIDKNSGALTFKTAPNYEAPDDVGGTAGDGIYIVNIRVIDLNGNHNDFTATITLNNVAEFGSLTLPNLSINPTKGVPVTITVTPTVAAGSAAGKMSFYLAGKRIAKCYKASFAGSGNATCTFKPAISGYQDVTVTYLPTNNEYASVTTKQKIWISRRSTNR